MLHYILALLCIQRVASFPDGAPAKACLSMSPLSKGGHGKSKIAEKAYADNPYQLLVTNLTYAPGQRIKVILTGLEQNFKGFLVEARSMRDLSAVPMGRFIDPHVGSKVMSCSVSKTELKTANNAWTHKDNFYKSDMWVTWIAPPTDEGAIFFRATVVKERFDYWENIFSDVVDYNGPTIQYGSERNQLGHGNGGYRHTPSIIVLMLHVITVFVLVMMMF